MKRFVLIKLLFVIILIFATMPQQAHADFRYAVKFVCGRSDGKILAPGKYYTAINVVNATDTLTELYKYFAIALPGEKPGPTSELFRVRLDKYKAMEIDCGDILKMTADIVKEARLTGEFLKGFVVIVSKVELDVVAVYTVTTTSGLWRISTVDIDIERVPPIQVR